MAEVLVAAGRSDEALGQLLDALDITERKEAPPLIRGVRALIRELEGKPVES
jgi:hypothetical protein